MDVDIFPGNKLDYIAEIFYLMGGIIMNKRTTGVIFCLIAAMLFSCRYISAAIFMSGILTWSNELFNAGLEYIGSPLLVLSILSLICGAVYLVWAEIGEPKKK